MARSGSAVTDLFSDIIDNLKDFIDDEIVDRTRDTERDLRKAARNLADFDDDATTGDVADLHHAVTALTAKVDALTVKK